MISCGVKMESLLAMSCYRQVKNKLLFKILKLHCIQKAVLPALHVNTLSLREVALTGCPEQKRKGKESPFSLLL